MHGSGRCLGVPQKKLHNFRKFRAPLSHPCVMKTYQIAAASVTVIAMSTLIAMRSPAASSGGATIPSIPVGMLTAYPTMVQTGTKPTLTWSILYPSKVSDLVEVQPPGTLIPNQTSYVTVQIVGTTITPCTSNQTITPVYTDARLSLNRGNFIQLFYGTQADVDPTKQLYIKKVYANDTIDFAGRFVQGNAWSPLYTTKSSNFQIVALVNGDTPPTSYNLYQSTNLASYLRPYLDASGKVNIGPLSVLILMELNTTNHSQQCFDYQDQVLLVTFSLKHPNNGHGNNLDGVDCSNPGQGHGGPNGMVDPSGGVDDEIR
jgi:hypothetical protein